MEDSSGIICRHVCTIIFILQILCMQYLKRLVDFYEIFRYDSYESEPHRHFFTDDITSGSDILTFKRFSKGQFVHGCPSKRLSVKVFRDGCQNIADVPFGIR